MFSVENLKNLTDDFAYVSKPTNKDTITTTIRIDQVCSDTINVVD